MVSVFSSIHDIRGHPSTLKDHFANTKKDAMGARKTIGIRNVVHAN